MFLQTFPDPAELLLLRCHGEELAPQEQVRIARMRFNPMIMDEAMDEMAREVMQDAS